MQNGLGIITFANGTRKAGIFQDNKLLELLTDKKQIISSELLLKMQFPKNFKQELKDYVSKLNPTENNQEYLNKNYHQATRESKAAPSGLRSMMTNSNAYGSEGGSRASRADARINKRGH